MVGQQEQGKALIRNLEDAGCPPDIIGLFVKCHKDERYPEQLRILSKQRRLLLDQLHDTQHKLECLDYLVYVVKREENT